MEDHLQLFWRRKMVMIRMLLLEGAALHRIGGGIR
jgi:hypothetical protein